MSRKNGRLSVAILIMGVFLANFAESATFNVTNPAGFQEALTTAQANSEADTINVAAGTYDVASTLSYSTTQNFDLIITGAGSATTILDGGNSVQIMRLVGEGSGDISISGLTFQHGRMSDIESFGGALFVNNSGTGSTTIDYCVATNSTAIRNAGGAWLGAVNGDITVTNSSFTYNTCDVGTSDDGCGLYLYFDTTEAVGNATVRNNIISHNTLNDNPHPVGGCDGAGMMIYHLGTGSFALTVEDNIISDNSSVHGVAGIVVRNPHLGATLSIIGNTFARNISGGTPYTPHPEIPGGAAHIYSDGGTMIINNNIFLDNEQRGPYDRGAGLCVDNFPSGIFRMANNVFAGNDCSHNGGGAQINLGSGVTSANIVGNLFVNNQANLTDGAGGGLMLNPQCDVNMINNTFYGNSAGGAAGLGYYCEGAGLDLAIINDIYRANTPDSISNLGTGTIAATYSNIDGGTGESYFGTGCIDTDPLFFNASNPPGADGIYATIDDGLHLPATSPSFNTGSNAAVPVWLTLDIAGQTRTQGGTVDMGAYEGVAGTPTAYNITMAVSPADSGTTSPAVGTHSVTSPQTIIATAAGGYVFTGWTTTAGLTAASPSSSSTSLSFNTDGTATANFAAIPATATLTMAVAPAAGGTTNPAIGAHVDQPTQVPINITATAADGYSFVNWTKTGSVTLGSSTQASTTATLLGDATVTANFMEIPDTVNLMFIHHSVGQNWLDSGLRAALDAKAYIDEVNEITYNDVVTPDAGRPSSLGDVAGDNTDMNTWLYWFNDYLGSVETFECTSGTNRIIMFKSCFPNSHIAEAGTGNGDPFDGTHTIVNHQAVFRNAAGAGTPYANGGYNYYALEDVFAANPDILFIPVTSPPECYSEATATTGSYARQFNDWLKNTWLPAYNAAHPGLNNVQVFDFFDFLANADTGATYANMLKAANGGDSGDSHPNETANAAATVLYATGTTNFMDLVWARFTSTAAQYAFTTAANPVAGGVTVPIAGTADSYTPLVISATAAEGYRFVNWTISANGQAYNTDSHLTTLLMSGATTATANFASVPYMTLGSVADFTVDDLIGFPGAQFGGKPSPFVTYTDPASATPKTKKTSLKCTFDKATPTDFMAEWTKKQALFNKKNIPVGTDTRTYLEDEGGIDNLICEFSVKAKDENRTTGTYSAGQIFVPPPEITDIRDVGGTSIITAAPGATVYVYGNYFGCKPPNFWFEYESRGRIKQSKCKVNKKLFSNLYQDSKGKPSCMNCTTGASMAPLVLPTRIPDGGLLDFIVIDNGLGRDTFDFTVE